MQHLRLNQHKERWKMAVAIKKVTNNASVAPHWHAHAKEIQKFGTVIEDMPHPLSAEIRADMVAKLNQLLADSITLRDMYKKHHWQVSGPTFYQLHLLFDKHFDEQIEMVDTIAERVQLLGGVTIAMAPDVAETTRIRRPPRGREEVPVQISRLLEAHKLIIQSCLDIADAASKAGDQGTNDLVVSDILRPNELQSWFIGQHLVEMPLILDK
jgi:starvation-inducible DNA-binding protein